MRVLFVLLTFAVVTANGVAVEGKPGPQLSHVTKSANGQYLFVMLSPLPLAKEIATLNEKAAAEQKAIRQKYAKSGLYKNDGSNQPLWTVDWYGSQVAIANDGEHLVKYSFYFGTSPSGKDQVPKSELQKNVLEFYANGKPLNKHSLAQLVDNPDKLIRPGSSSTILWMDKPRILDDNQQFELTTQEGKRILFDLKTGKILKKDKLPA